MSKLPERWEHCELREILEYITSGSRDWSKYYSDSGANFIRTQDINTNTLCLDGVAKVQLPENVEGKRTLVKCGDVLITITGANIGKCAIIDKPLKESYVSQSVALLRFRDIELSPFIHLQLITAQDNKTALQHAAYGMGRPVLNLTNIEDLQISLAPLPEQKRIVAKIEELFSELDKGVESLKTVRDQLTAYRQALLKHAFEGKLTGQWREENKDKLETTDQLIDRIQEERETRYQQALKDWERAVQAWEKKGKPAKKPTPIANLSHSDIAKLPTLPHGWVWLSVENLCDVVRGGSPRPAGDKRYYDGNIPFLKVADLTRKSGAYLDTFTYTIKEAGLQKTRLVRPNTLLISNSGATLGVPKICLIEATFNDGIAAFLGLPDDQLPFYYYFWLSKTAALRGINQGAAQPNLNTSLLGRTPIPVCSQEEMQIVAGQIEKALSVSDQLSEQVDNELNRSEALRQSILKHAFSGKLVQQDPNDEPASVLLERIRTEKHEQAKDKNSKKRKDAA